MVTFFQVKRHQDEKKKYPTDIMKGHIALPSFICPLCAPPICSTSISAWAQPFISDLCLLAKRQSAQTKYSIHLYNLKRNFRSISLLMQLKQRTHNAFCCNTLATIDHQQHSTRRSHPIFPKRGRKRYVHFRSNCPLSYRQTSALSMT